MEEKKQLSHMTNLFLMCARKVIEEDEYYSERRREILAEREAERLRTTKAGNKKETQEKG